MNVIIQKKGKVENLEKSGIIKLDKVMNNSTTIKSHIATSSKQPLNARGFPHDFVNKIICGDVVEIMKQIPDGSVDVVVTSPPYNLKNSTGNGMKDGRGGKWANAALQKGYTHHHDCMPHDEYVEWQRKCLTEM